MREEDLEEHSTPGLEVDQCVGPIRAHLGLIGPTGLEARDQVYSRRRRLELKPITYSLYGIGRPISVLPL